MEVFFSFSKIDELSARQQQPEGCRIRKLPPCFVLQAHGIGWDMP
jgi:hypothetical protein